MNIAKKVEVVNFRSHSHYILDLKNPTTLITGKNGSGKTSLIEALYISLRGKSFRSCDDDIIKDQEDFYSVKTIFSDSKKRSLIYKKGFKKEFLIDDKKYTRLPKKYKYPVVLFEPDDLNLIHSSPSKRRNFIDSFISQFDESYAQATSRYEKALRQRNILLKSCSLNKDDIFPWNVILAKYGSEITNKRLKTVLDINNSITNIYRTIYPSDNTVSINYNKEEIDESTFLRNLEISIEKDIVVGFTTYGPHRDDLVFNFNDNLAVSTASRGELRSIILSLKFIEAKTITDILSKEPIILLDDIFSELDETRQSHLTNNFKNHQVIITSTLTPKTINIDNTGIKSL